MKKKQAKKKKEKRKLLKNGGLPRFNAATVRQNLKKSFALTKKPKTIREKTDVDLGAPALRRNGEGGTKVVAAAQQWP